MNPTVISSRIEADGAARVASTLTSTQWLAVRRRIEKGHPLWLKVASSLYNGTDGGDSELLVLAVGVALGRAPASVLRITTANMPIRGICGLPDLTDPRTDSRQKTQSYLSDRLKTVEKLTAKDLAGPRNECLCYLRRARDEVESASGPFGERQ